MTQTVTIQPEFEFSPREISDARRNNRLLSMEIEFSLRCNFHCPYCYVPPEPYFEDELSLAEIEDAICQARDLGARKIIILGGEPTLYPHIRHMIRFIRKNGMIVELFSNGAGIGADFAEFLHAENVRVVLKMNTFDEKLQDRLAGKTGAYRIIWSAFEHLRQAGYPSRNAFLAASTIICRQNIDELPRMWQWLRNRGIAPYFEIITPQSNALENQWLNVDAFELRDLFYRIAEIDKKHYSHIWKPQPPLVGNKCLRHQFSCLLTSKGDVMPCVGVTLSIGNIRQKKLADIIAESDVLAALKNHRETIKGPCRECERADACYGCRGAAFQLTGDYLASDPLCWKNCEAKQKTKDIPCITTARPQRGCQ